MPQLRHQMSPGISGVLGTVAADVGNLPRCRQPIPGGRPPLATAGARPKPRTAQFVEALLLPATVTTAPEARKRYCFAVLDSLTAGVSPRRGRDRMTLEWHPAQ